MYYGDDSEGSKHCFTKGYSRDADLNPLVRIFSPPAAAEGFTIAISPTQKESWADFPISETPRGVKEVDLEEDDQVIGQFDSAEASNILVILRAHGPPATADAAKTFMSSPVGTPNEGAP